ncbi:glycosyltransferase, partial [Vibrio cholerae]|nr:glycosyltransferase [Vibrio cholerae]
MISVIMSVYNAEKYLSESIESILKQTFRDFEFICIDDGSTDSSLEILKKYRDLDPRIILVSRDNKGLIYSLNEGLSLARYNYIARMDADDIAREDRLEKQYRYLSNKKNVSVVGSYFNVVNEDGTFVKLRKLPKSNFILKPFCIFGSPFAHPAVMLNRSIILDGLYYDERYPSAEDYELWLRLSFGKTKFANIPEPLLNYRILNTSISRSRKEEQEESMFNAIKIHFFMNRLNNDDFCFLFGNRDGKVIPQLRVLIQQKR